ncbi:MAG: GIY-YIG nuclease family protein [Rhodomicrobium sp.]
MARYWVYILASKRDGVLYTGVTNNLAARVHNIGAVRGRSSPRNIMPCASSMRRA